MKSIECYFQKRGIKIDHILSVFCSGRNTVICLDSSEEISCTIRFYELTKLLPENEFVIISRGILVRKNAILAISDDGVYTMIDGRTFQGRKRFLSEHKKLRKELHLNNSAELSNPTLQPQRLPLVLLEKCSILDDMPVAYCVIELVFDEAGHGIDFIFRYCNKQMEVIEGVPVEYMVDHSFYEVFKNGDRKWLVAYADVALNGVQRTLHDYSPEIGKTLTILCYQPEPGYCACVLTEDGHA
ncbi:MAG: LytTR family transcriptional regulator DNA-binding domain-containing protein [Lachnospiraceae bacterium]